MNDILLLPQPRTLQPGDGQHVIAPGRRIVLLGAPPAALLFSARRLQQALRQHAAVDWQLSAALAGPDHQVGLIVQVAPAQVPQPEGYRLTINSSQITVLAHDPAGVFYAVATLVQLLEQRGPHLPCLQLEDAPDFAHRGVMLDISRDKVPTMETLYSLIDRLATWKINQIQLYTEHTFAYHRHPEVWARASPITGEEVLALDAFCRERFIDLVPNQNSFGHMHRWLEHPRYQPLAEVDEPFYTPGGYLVGPYSLCPGEPGSLQLIDELYDELLPHFSSRQFNVGCDETFDLGRGRSAADCAERGTGRVYLEFLQKIGERVRARGLTMQFWGDIVLSEPALIPELPPESIALAWGYEADYPFDSVGAQFAAAGVPFYVCPGTSSWNSLAGRTDNALANLRSAAEAGLAHGARGYLITDWGDNGHWQALPISYLGFAVGAAFAWCYEANRTLNVAAALSWHAFGDPTCETGHLAYRLGNLYQAAGDNPSNASSLFHVLRLPLADIPSYIQRRAFRWDHALAAIEQEAAALAAIRPSIEAGLVRAELEQTVALLRHACRRAQFAQQPDTPGLRQALAEDIARIIASYPQLWAARNRPGGLADSLVRLERLREDYA